MTELDSNRTPTVISSSSSKPSIDTLTTSLSPKPVVVDDSMTPPSPPFARQASNTDRPSRPLSEISNNSERRRSMPASTKGASGEGKERSSRSSSRPVSEIRDKEGEHVTAGAGTNVTFPKRVSSGVGLHTLTVDLVEYARQQGSSLAPPATTLASRDKEGISQTTTRPTSGVPPAPPSPTTKPILNKEKAVNIGSASSTPRKQPPNAQEAVQDEEKLKEIPSE